MLVSTLHWPGGFVLVCRAELASGVACLRMWDPPVMVEDALEALTARQK